MTMLKINLEARIVERRARWVEAEKGMATISEWGIAISDIVDATRGLS
jgi:hypothetical protein